MIYDNFFVQSDCACFILCFMLVFRMCVCFCARTERGTYSRYRLKERDEGRAVGADKTSLSTLPEA